MSARYLVSYYGPTYLTAVFSAANYSSVGEATKVRDMLAGDGFSARILRVTVVNGQPVAEWVDE